jgi:hypothetical protein
MATTSSTSWLSMPASDSDRSRWRSIPVAEIIALHREMAATRARIAELEKAQTMATTSKKDMTKKKPATGKAGEEKELRLYGGGRKPKDYRLAHNNIMHVPGFPHGANGFRRFWIPPQWIGDGWRECPCGWRPEAGTHYAIDEHAKWWAAEIKKHGGLDAVVRRVAKRLARDHIRPM